MSKKIYWEIFLQCFMYYIGCIVLVLSIVVLTSFHLMIRSNHYWVLIVFGIISGLLFGFLWNHMFVTYLRGIAISVTFKNKGEFINKIDTMLKRMDYHLESKNNNILIYSSSKWMENYIGKMSIHLHDTSVTIVGSTKQVRKVWKQLKAA